MAQLPWGIRSGSGKAPRIEANMSRQQVQQWLGHFHVIPVLVSSVISQPTSDTSAKIMGGKQETAA